MVGVVNTRDSQDRRGGRLELSLGGVCQPAGFDGLTPHMPCHEERGDREQASADGNAEPRTIRALST